MVAGVVGRSLRDRIPAHRVAHDIDAEPVELVEPRLERARAVGEPGVVLDPVERAGRSVRRVRSDERGERAAATNDERPHESPLLEYSAREMSSFAVEYARTSSGIDVDRRE